MQLRPRGYPHPVLSYFSDDIVGSEFQSTVSVSGTKTAYLFSVTAKTSDDGLLELIKTARAQYAVHVECASTRYRSIFSNSSERFSFQIPASEIDGRVELCSFIVAVEDIPHYVNKGFHEDYQGRSFAVRRGDTLAVAPEASFIAEKKTDPLRKIPSIFLVIPNEREDAPAMDIDTTDHKVQISLSIPNFEAYSFLRQAQPLQTSLNSMIIVPALVAVLEDIKRSAMAQEGLADLESRRWYSTVARRLRELGIDPAAPEDYPTSTPALAHKLIGEPLTDGLRNLRGYEETEEEVHDG